MTNPQPPATGPEKPNFGSQTEWITAGIILAVGIPVALIFMSCSGSGSNKPASVPYEAIKACQERVRSEAMHPSTVKFQSTGQASDRDESGNIRVRIGYTAKNSFGMESRMDSLCRFEPGSSTRIAQFGTWEKNR